MAVSTQWGAIQGSAELQGKIIPSIDGLIAVSGLVHNCIVVTRNTADMKNTGVELLNPWISIS
jgi:predicted nucleic acid-binding protein